MSSIGVKMGRRDLWSHRESGLTAGQILAMRTGRASQNPGGEHRHDAYCHSGNCKTQVRGRQPSRNPGPWMGSDVPPSYYTDYGGSRPSYGPRSEPATSLEGPQEARQITPYTLPGPARINQLAATVSAQGCCYPPPTPAVVCEIRECLPELFADCFGQNVMYFDPLSHQMFLLDKSQQGCVFAAADAGCCPDVLSPITAVRSPLVGAAFLFIADFGDDVVGQWLAADKTFIDLAFPVGIFASFLKVFVKGTPANPEIIVQKECTKEMLREDATAQFCSGMTPT